VRVFALAFRTRIWRAGRFEFLYRQFHPGL
jgi:hypothetical protein